jgi:hypothetical protein
VDVATRTQGTICGSDVLVDDAGKRTPSVSAVIVAMQMQDSISSVHKPTEVTRHDVPSWAIQFHRVGV